MAIIPINLGGGGGSGSSDDCTATAADILESKTAIYDGSDDEAEYGSMKDYSGTTSAGTSSLDSSNSRVQLAIPSTGKYDTSSKLYQSYSNIATLIGLTASKIGTGNSILGISGSYTGVGTATASQVLTGYTFSNASGSGLSGSMSNYGGSTVSATASLDSSNSRVRMAVPSNGYYSTSSYLYTSYSNMRTLIGYTDASKVLSGTTILGLAGTMSDKSGTTSSATSSLDSSNSRVRLQIPSNGYYNTSAYLYATYSNIASLIGLTAAKVVSGNTILGISGSASEYTEYVSSGDGYDIYPGTLSNATWARNSSSGDVSVTCRTITMSSLGLSSLSFTPKYLHLMTDDGYAGWYFPSGCNLSIGSNTRNGYYAASSNSAYSFTKTSINIPMYFSSSSSSTATPIWFTIIGTK